MLTRCPSAMAGAAAIVRRSLATTAVVATSKPLNHQPLSQADPELYELLQKEGERQRTGLELIASENFTSKAVMEVMGSCLTNKYSEGKVGARYYGGNKYIDEIESLCQQRCLEVFGLSPDEWGVNVQPLSGSPANMAVYTGLLKPHDRLMGLNLPDGGHLTHGYYTGMKDGTVKPISATSVFFESLPYRVHDDTGLIDYDYLAEMASVFKPRLIICGASAYSRDYDYARFREIADECGAYLHCDMAHNSGLVAAGVLSSPFEYCDVVSSTTHKTLRGPRSGIIIGKKDIMEAIDFAVFPMLQGGPHNHAIGALAAQLKEVQSPEFKEYIKQVVANAQALASALQDNGNKIATGGTDTHLMLWDLRPHGITGSKMELLCDHLNITLNKNTIHGDRNALNPGAVRVGTPALTTRGFKEDDFKTVASLLMRAVEVAKSIQDRTGKPLKAFREGIEGDDAVQALRKDVIDFASAFPMPGHD